MSDISLKKPFKHFPTSAVFLSTKVATDATNTSYIQNGEVHEGTPDVLWENTAFIHDIAQIWNRGRYYNSQKYLGKLAAMSKNSFQMYSGMTIVTLVDKNPEALDADAFQNYPGILPSIVVVPGSVSNVDHILQLVDKGCDILSTAFNGTSVYDGTAAKDLNYDNILDDMTAVEQWLIEHGLFTNCYKYPDAAKAQGESEFIQRYEEYGLVESGVAVNRIRQDNMLLNAKTLTTDAHCTAAATEIGEDNGNWLVYVIDTANISSSGLDDLIESIQTGIDNGDCIYMQMHEGLQMRASELNIGRSEATLPFRVFKDGKVQAELTGESLQDFIGDNLSYNSTTGKIDADNSQSNWNEDNPVESSYIQNKPEITSEVTYQSNDILTSGGAYESMNSDDYMWKITYFVADHLFTYLDINDDFLMAD